MQITPPDLSVLVVAGFNVITSHSTSDIIGHFGNNNVIIICNY